MKPFQKSLYKTENFIAYARNHYTSDPHPLKTQGLHQGIIINGLYAYLKEKTQFTNVSTCAFISSIGLYFKDASIV